MNYDNGEGPSRTNNNNNNNVIPSPTFGVGAPSDRNWNGITKMIYTAGDQGDKLPAVGSSVLYKLDPQLKHKEEFDQWYEGIVKILRGHNLHRLIDNAIERPLRNSPNAELWIQLSMQISAWLAHCIDPVVVRDITSTGECTDKSRFQFRQICLYPRFD
ncbi:hypothetical protein VN97_g549 [Penicillium thymicola]|uniref:Uncharacterized protein n=1 Tax=Penicillium thymicola TaxID=293382 RepID=A0AAI9TSL8_PENTH|nr:hypothetical protein VN97_g549 [Penicillium thymicola]